MTLARLKDSKLTNGTLITVAVGLAGFAGYLHSAQKTIDAMSAAKVEIHRREEIDVAHPGVAKRLDRIEQKLDRLLELMR